MKPTLQVVWFKRDLRLQDHEPLAQAAKRGPVLPLYIAEPSLFTAPDFDARHWTFIRASLIELRRRLFALGQPLVVRTGEAVPVFEALLLEAPFARIWAHEETGHWLSFRRDQDVRAWAKERGVRVTELTSNGVAREMTDSDAWPPRWDEWMRRPPAAPPMMLGPASGVEPGPIPDHADLGLLPDATNGAQCGGVEIARQTLGRFLSQRGERYAEASATPAIAADACSRISPYLTWGNLSVRQVLHATRSRVAEVRQLAPEHRGDWPAALSAFELRLRWRSQHVQRLEDNRRIEFENDAGAYDGLREHEFDRAHFAAWAAGQTGYPLIDAAMRALHRTGWLTFRMRAMLVSFASYDLWLHWREPGLHLARLSLDFDPGIHWIQMQTHAGTTGDSTMLVYNPTKQAHDCDPAGIFIRRWVPELAAVPAPFVHTPWLMPHDLQLSIGCVIGTDYPAPIVDHAVAARDALRRVYAARPRSPDESQAETSREQHATRRQLPNSPRVKRIRREKPTQLSFPLE